MTYFLNFIPYSRLFWRALNLANWSKNVIGEFKFGECMFHAQVLRKTSLIIDTRDVIKKSVHYSECVNACLVVAGFSAEPSPRFHLLIRHPF